MYQAKCICETCGNYSVCKEDWWVEQRYKPILAPFDDITFEDVMADLDVCEDYIAP